MWRQVHGHTCCTPILTRAKYAMHMVDLCFRAHFQSPNTWCTSLRIHQVSTLKLTQLHKKHPLEMCYLNSCLQPLQKAVTIHYLVKCDSLEGIHLIQLWMYTSEMVTLNSLHTQRRKTDISESDSSDLFQMSALSRDKSLTSAILFYSLQRKLRQVPQM